MKEQDKIYVGIQDLGSGYATSVSITPQEGHSEYIRKDALLEWAEKKIAKGTIDEWDKGYVQCLKDLIEKLESFR